MGDKPVLKQVISLPVLCNIQNIEAFIKYKELNLISQ